jgi:hypothetical protein
VPGAGGKAHGQPFLHAKWRVGSIHNSMHYERHDRGFHSSDTPATALAARVAVKASMRSIRAGEPRWDDTTNLASPRLRPQSVGDGARSAASRLAELAVPKLPVRASFQIAAHDPKHYTYNFRAEALPKPLPVETDRFGRITRVAAVS